jgi:hypothetical protein
MPVNEFFAMPDVVVGGLFFQRLVAIDMAGVRLVGQS